MKNKKIYGIAKILTALSVIAAVPFAAVAMQGKPPKTTIAEKRLFDYHQITLDNGMKVITLEDFSTPIVAVQVWYHVGSKNEDPNRRGFAHMFEHMLFKGTYLVGETDHFALIRGVGGTCNGYTSFDKTVYLETLPANQLALALWLEAERMGFLRINQARFDTERKVVEEERRMHLNEPYGTLWEKQMPEIFKVHPYRWLPIGNIPHLRAASVEELRNFWKAYYVPSNATLIIVGAVKHAEAEALAKKYFGWMPTYPAVPQVHSPEPLPTQPRSVSLVLENAPAPMVRILYPTVSISHPDDIPLTLLASILGGGNSSRLYRELVAEKQLAVDVSAEQMSLEQEGFFAADATLTPSTADSNAIAVILEEQIGRLRTQPVTEKELLKAKNQMLKSLATRTLTVDSRASMLGEAAVEMGNVARANQILSDVRKVTAADLLRVAQEYFQPQRRLIIKIPRSQPDSESLNNKAYAEGSITAAPEKVEPPAGRTGVKRPADYPLKAPLAADIKLPKMPNFTTRTLSNGIKVMVVPNPKAPFVSFRMGFDAGAWTEQKAGSASMAMQMLTKGTAKHTEGQLAEELETYAISLGGSGAMDNSSVSGNCLSEHIEKAMSLMAEVVLTPTFGADEFEKLRKQVLTGLAIKTADPEYIAERTYKKVLYGGHPYARTATGEIGDVEALHISDIKDWYSRFIRSDTATLIFAGDIDEATAVKLAEAAFSTWKAGSEQPHITLLKPPNANSLRIYLVDNPGVQSRIQMGEYSITRKNPQSPLSRVVSSYFGFGFDSRLNQSVRVEKGLTYGVWGGYIAERFAGEFAISTFTKTPSTAKTVQAVLDEVTRLKTQPPSAKEVASSRSYILGSFIGRWETPSAVAEDLWLIESQGLPADYFDRLLSGVRDADANSCVALVKDTVDTNKMAVIVVGDANAVKPELEKIAPVKLTR